MNEKVPCSKCGAFILSSTALKTNGLCMPCKGGYRERMEAAKKLDQEERERDRTDPFRKLWLSLVHQIHDSSAGFDGLSHPEKLYFAVGCLEGDVYNGGFHQYFFNDAGSYYPLAEEGLISIGAFQTLELLKLAKEVLFASETVPVNTIERRRMLPHYPESNLEKCAWSAKLDDLDKRYWEDSEAISERMRTFARECQLVPHGA